MRHLRDDNFKTAIPSEDMQGLYKKILKGQLPKIPEHFSNDMLKMPKVMIQVSPKKRPNCLQLDIIDEEYDTNENLHRESIKFII